MRNNKQDEFLILSILAERSLHGYEISKQIKKKSSGSLTMQENKLYPALHRLEENKLVSAEWIPQEGKPDRKVYSITPQGIQELDQQRSAWQRMVDGVNSILQNRGEQHG
jgi:PadR family transcriptional regulator, regulatory protein PadR